MVFEKTLFKKTFVSFFPLSFSLPVTPLSFVITCLVLLRDTSYCLSSSKVASGSILRPERIWSSSSKIDDEEEEEEVWRSLDLLETEQCTARRLSQIGNRQVLRQQRISILDFNACETRMTIERGGCKDDLYWWNSCDQ